MTRKGRCHVMRIVNTCNCCYSSFAHKSKVMSYTQYFSSGTPWNFWYQCPTYTKTDIQTNGHTTCPRILISSHKACPISCMLRVFNFQPDQKRSITNIPPLAPSSWRRRGRRRGETWGRRRSPTWAGCWATPPTPSRSSWQDAWKKSNWSQDILISTRLIFELVKKGAISLVQLMFVLVV